MVDWPLVLIVCLLIRLGEKGLGRTKRHRNTPSDREKPRTDWKNDLQICGPGRKSRKRPTLAGGKNPNRKSQLTMLSRVKMVLKKTVWAIRRMKLYRVWAPKLKEGHLPADRCRY